MIYPVQKQSTWIVALVVLAALLSPALACATPFAAFAALAAVTLPRREAIVCSTLVWLANQAMGFIVLGYPLNSGAMIWSTILATSIVATTIIAQNVCIRGSFINYGAAMASAFFVAQAVFRALMIIAAYQLGGIEGFTMPNLAYLSGLDAMTFVGALLVAEGAAVMKNVGRAERAHPSV